MELVPELEEPNKLTGALGLDRMDFIDFNGGPDGELEFAVPNVGRRNAGDGKLNLHAAVGTLGISLLQLLGFTVLLLVMATGKVALLNAGNNRLLLLQLLLLLPLIPLLISGDLPKLLLVRS